MKKYLISTMIPFAVFLSTSPVSVYAIDNQSSNHSCSAFGSTLAIAKLNYQNSCDLPRVDCDPADGQWTCSSERIESNPFISILDTEARDSTDSTSVCIDTDGDGWGWDGESSCVVTGSVVASSCIDSDGDGWGWNGVESCLVSQVATLPEAGSQNDSASNEDSEAITEGIIETSGLCYDSDGDGWGWNGTQSCMVDMELQDSSTMDSSVEESISQESTNQETISQETSQETNVEDDLNSLANDISSIVGIWNDLENQDIHIRFSGGPSATEIKADGTFVEWHYEDGAVGAYSSEFISGLLVFTDEELIAVGWDADLLTSFREQPSDCYVMWESGPVTHVGDNVFKFEATDALNPINIGSLRTLYLVKRGNDLLYDSGARFGSIATYDIVPCD